MVKSELVLFQMQGKGLLGDTIELCQTTFGTVPERPDAIDIAGVPDEFVTAVIAPEMLRNAHVYQTMVTKLAVGIHDADGINLYRG